MAKKMRVYELARELGLSNAECLELCESLGVGVKSHSSSMEEAHADRVRRKAEREGLIRKPEPEPEPEAPVEAAEPKNVVSSRKPPPRKPASAAEAPVAPGGEAASSAPAAPPATPPAAPKRVVTSSGSAGPVRAPAPVEAPAPPAAAPPAAPAPTTAPGSADKAAAKPAAAKGAPPAAPQRPDPASVPTSLSGKPIPPPPPPRSLSGKPIPPPPGMGGRKAAPRPAGGGARPRPGGGAGAPRPGGAPGGPRPGGGPPGRGRGGPQRQPRRRKSRRRRRSLEELQPVDVPMYTPDNAPVPDGLTVIERHSTPAELGAKLNRTAADVVRFLLTNGEMVTATQSLSDDLIELFAADIGAEIRLVDLGEEREEEMKVLLEAPDFDGQDQVDRPPVITVMGHVDHGKTKLLDYIRNADVVAGEAGGITQHIGAYQVDRDGQLLTFIDTPGHEAFTAIRARGAMATDIVILVVAADDGVMPQTVEAINHARAADRPIVVAVNKMDRENANPDRVLTQLAEYNLVPEEWGGDTIVVKISALLGDGVDELLDALLLVADVEELTAVPNGRAAGVVLESNLDVGRGPVSTILVQQGVLEVGQPLIAGAAWGRVRALINDKGEQVKKAGPSAPVEVLGLSDVTRSGDDFLVAKNEKIAGKVAATREHWQRVAGLGRDSGAAAAGGGARLEDLFREIQSGKTAQLNLIVKADVQGSLEALLESLRKLERPDVKLSIVHSGVGGMNEKDISLAQASNATIIGFNVRPDRNARDLARTEGVEIRTYEIIYKVIEEIEAAMLGMLEPVFEEVVTGEAEVRELFRIKGVGAVAGCFVNEGTIRKGDKVRFLRDGAVIWKGILETLKRFQDDVDEVRNGSECGVSLSDFQDLKQGDVIETYEEREIPHT